MKKYRQLDRFVELIKRYIIHNQGLPTADELASEFNISKRTAFRDLEYLRELILEQQTINNADSKTSDKT